MTIAEVCASGLAVGACLFDLKYARIPNALTVTAAVLAFAFHCSTPEGAGVGAAAMGLLTGLALFFPLFVLRAMGGGDVKLMAALGAWLGWYPMFWVALYGSVAGGVLALVVAIAHEYVGQALTNIKHLLVCWCLTGVRPLPALTLQSTSALRLPYALPIAVGLGMTLWLR